MQDIIEIAGYSFPTLIAITPDEFETGLMFQKWPPPVMVFPFEKAGIHKFYMKNTPSPLDIIFCHKNKIAYIDEGIPLSLKHIGPEFPIDLVIEMPKGTLAKYCFKIGDSISLKRSLLSLAKHYETNILKAE